MIHDSLKAGGAGCSIGRNVFEHPRRTQLVQAMRAIVHGDADVETALKLVGE
jgi:class I fructose-bisphosphate aldolase